MIADALAGKIDLIVTKSVSRFARNTVDPLRPAGLLVTLMSSLAQEESRSISENVTWGQRKRMADGKVSIPYGRFLGYRKGDDGLPEVVPEEAEVVRLIYRSFMEGLTSGKIAQMLMEKNITAPGGKEKWHSSTIESRKRLKSIRAKFRSISWNTVTRPSLLRRNLNWCRLK